MANGTKTSNDPISIVIGVVIIIVAIMLAVAIIVTVLRRVGYFDSELPVVEDTRIQPAIWGSEEVVSPCTGYRLPPIDSTTPSNTINYSANLGDLTPHPGGFSPCLWQDEINRQYERATCLSAHCTDQYGMTHSRGGRITYPTNCEVSSRCLGSLGVIAMGNNEPIDDPLTEQTDSDSGYHCFSSSSIGRLGMSTCSLLDSMQYFIMEPRSEALQSIVRIRQRDAAYTLTVDYYDNVILLSNTLIEDSGHHWLIIPQYSVQEGTTSYSSPSQLGYVGLLPDSIVSNPDHYLSPTSIRSFIIMYGIKTINNSLQLEEWEYGITDAEVPEGGRVYNSQSIAFTSINRMSDIPHILS